MKTLILLATLAMSGCAYQSADTYDISQAVKFCGSYDKILYIRVHATGNEVIKCIDGKWAYTTGVK